MTGVRYARCPETGLPASLAFMIYRHQPGRPFRRDAGDWICGRSHQRSAGRVSRPASGRQVTCPGCAATAARFGIEVRQPR